MSSKKKLTLDQFTEKVGTEAPDFTRALQEEESYLQLCKKVREDLKQLRVDMGVRQSKVADDLQMSQPAVSKIENGEGDIGLVTLCRYADALGMQPVISFAPAASTYLEHDALKTTLRTMEKLSEARLARAHNKIHARKSLAATSAATTQDPAGPDSAMFGEVASAMSGAVTQSLSTEIASLMSAFSEFRLDEDNDC